MPRMSKAFKQNEVKTSTEAPAGDYVALIVASDVTESKKAGAGEMVVLTFQIAEGPRKGHRVKTYLCINHQNETAAAIANRTLKECCEACELDHALEDTDDLHGKPLIVELGVENSEEFGPQNRVRKVKHRSKGIESAPKAGRSANGNGATKADVSPWDNTPAPKPETPATEEVTEEVPY